MKVSYFITVNYGTSDLIEKWVVSIRRNINNSKITIVDNFYSDREREKTKQVCEKLNVNLILSSNIGYGRALNKAINYAFQVENGNFLIFAGNMDIEYINIPKKIHNGKCVFVPQIIENKRNNRNPFLTKIQKKVFIIYYLAGLLNSINFLKIAIGINKIVSLIPSQIWATHGSLFCFNSKCIENSREIFNESSFLYCEELEFASFMENIDAIFIKADIKVFHFGQVATKEVNKSKKDFFTLWWPSFKNWWKRWK
jgi:hypothetical protein